jgi:glycerophosphoryl diester phosphodiesterase
MRPLIIAHRGASAIAPENTLAAVNLAWELNADCVEIDIHLTKDNKIVVIHDPSTKRTTDNNLVISETTSNELRKLDAGSYKSKIFKGEKIPFIEEILESLPPEHSLIIEIKSPPEIVKYLKQSLTKSGKINQIIIKSFDINTLKTAKEVFPETQVFLLHYSSNNIFFESLKICVELTAVLKENKFNGLSLYHENVTDNLAKSFIDSGLKLLVWTVNESEKALDLARKGIYGIITDNPQLILKTMEENRL